MTAEPEVTFTVRTARRARTCRVCRHVKRGGIIAALIVALLAPSPVPAAAQPAAPVGQIETTWRT